MNTLIEQNLTEGIIESTEMIFGKKKIHIVKGESTHYSHRWVVMVKNKKLRLRLVLNQMSYDVFYEILRQIKVLKKDDVLTKLVKGYKSGRDIQIQLNKALGAPTAKEIKFDESMMDFFKEVSDEPVITLNEVRDVIKSYITSKREPDFSVPVLANGVRIWVTVENKRNQYKVKVRGQKRD